MRFLACTINNYSKTTAKSEAVAMDSKPIVFCALFVSGFRSCVRCLLGHRNPVSREGGTHVAFSRLDGRHLSAANCEIEVDNVPVPCVRT